MPGTIGIVDAARANPVEKAQVMIVLEEKLRDRACRAGVDLGFQDIDVGVDVGTFGMTFGIGGDRYFEIGDAPDPGDERRRTSRSRPRARR